MQIFFTKNAWEDFTYWKKENEETLERIKLLIKAIEGEDSLLGKPTPVQISNQNLWSRKIDYKHSLVYRLSDSPQKICTILQCRFHED